MLKKIAGAALLLPLCLAGVADAESETASLWVEAKDLAGETHLLKTGFKGKALNAFRMQFDTSDHEINALGFLPAQDRIFVALSDQGADDKYSFEGLFVSNPGAGTSRKATGECDGSHNVCKLKLDVASSELGNVFVLQGFKFKRKGSNDANVRRIMVRGNLAAKRVEVLFVDNGKTPYSAQVQFLTAPPSRYEYVGTANGSHKSGAGGLAIKTNRSSIGTVISGFDVEFENGDHHLREFSIIPGNQAIGVQFRDQNADDPFRAAIDYASLKTGT